MRTFIAIALPTQIRRALSELKEQLNTPQITSLRWVPVNNIHLTLKFIGEIETRKVPSITQIMTETAGKIYPFDIQIRGLGAFPRGRKPRIIWVGCKLPDAGYALQKELEDRLVPLGIAKENRNFHPHLTLARVSKCAKDEDYQKITEMVIKSQWTKSWNLRVDQVKLYRSELLPGGAQYRVVAEVNLDPKSVDGNSVLESDRK